MSEFIAEYIPYELNFKRPSGTSRGILKIKKVWFVKIWKSDEPKIVGWGECNPLVGLSIDDREDFEEQLSEVCENIDLYAANFHSSLEDWPSIRFALESAFLDLKNGGNRLLFDTDFSRGKSDILINGLVWMGNKDFMLQQIKEKVSQGFSCIKLKIGAIDFESEIELLRYIRESFPEKELTIRVDANGAFSPDTALSKLQSLSRFNIHSIEQPIAVDQWELLRELCFETPVPIALDEELIAVQSKEDRIKLLEYVRPQYIILKPSLIGGMQSGDEWIEIAENLGIGWWITSALESNIGLNVIAQWTASKSFTIPQGLGTGQLYTNNISSPLKVEGENLIVSSDTSWILPT